MKPSHSGASACERSTIRWQGRQASAIWMAGSSAPHSQVAVLPRSWSGTGRVQATRPESSIQLIDTSGHDRSWR
jgi:hypothetical protein